MAEVFIRHMVAKTRARGAEGLVSRQAPALTCARKLGVRWGVAVGRKQCMIPVFMYKKYTFNTPEGGMQSYFCDKYNNACARRRAHTATAPGFLAPGGRVGRWL